MTKCESCVFYQYDENDHKFSPCLFHASKAL